MAKILICEDDALLAFDLAKIIEDSGHDVCGIYRSASSALADCHMSQPDAAIVDLQLADGNTGAALAQTLQELGVRVIVVSGHSNVNVGLGSVSHTYAPKPLSPELVQLLLDPIKSRINAEPSRANNDGHDKAIRP